MGNIWPSVYMKMVVCGNHSPRGTHDGQKYFNSPNKNMLFNILPHKIKKKNWRIEGRWTIEAVAKIKLQIITYFRYRKQNKRE